jgi:MarR family transcriptional regulator, organic hydroperoxide resistance regulator
MPARKPNSENGSQLSRFAGPLDSPGFVFWRDFMLWQRELNAVLKPHGLTQPQFAVLACCAWMTRKAEAVSQSRLVEALGLDKMHVSQVVGRLEDSGLLSRQGSAADLRIKELRVSRQGQQLLARCFPLVEAHDAAFFAGRR